MALLDYKYYNYDRFKNLQPITSWDDLKVGSCYHIPPTILYNRRDIIIEGKDDNKILCQMREDGKWFRSTIYRSEISSKFLAKSWTLVNK